MKLSELLVNQKIIVQLIWDDQKIEFFSNVIEKNITDVYITPYFHGESVYELNVHGDKGVVCNLFTDDAVTKQRISWRGVELTTVDRNGKKVYCLKTHSFNNVSNLDDRRRSERVVVELMAELYDSQQPDVENIIVHDISDTGISFYTRENFEPKSQQMTIKFTDMINSRTYNVQVECSIARMVCDGGHLTVGCRIVGENKNYQLYELMKRLAWKAEHGPAVKKGA